MPFTGYRFYRGVGDVSNVDFDAPVATAGKGDSSVEIVGLGHNPSTRYVYAARAVLDDIETPDVSCTVEFQTGPGGDWVGQVPAAVEVVHAVVQSAGRITLGWSYRTPEGGEAPADFAVYCAHSSAITRGSPHSTLAFTRDGPYGTTLNLADGETYYFAVTARTAEGVESPLSDVIGPYVADASAPPQPVVYTRTVF